jgi:hypothetical protein
MLLVILPLLLLGLTGWIGSAKRKFDDHFEGVLNFLVFYIALPSVVFLSITQSNLNQVINLSFGLAYLLSIFIVYIVVITLSLKVMCKSLTKSILISMNSSLSNSGLIGMPILIILFGHQGTIAAVQVMLVSSIIIPFLLISIEYSISKNKSDEKIIFSTFKKTLFQPFIFCVIISLIINVFNIYVPSFVIKYASYLSVLIIPCSFIAAGSRLQKNHFKNIGMETIIVSIINSIIKPLLAIFLAFIFGLPKIYAVSLVVISSAPVSSSIYVIASRYNVYKEESANTLLITSLLAILFLPLYSSIAMYLWS